MYKIYNVQNGDTLENIARRLGVTPDVLATLNGLDVTTILKPNTSIVIPTSQMLFEKYIIKKGDTIYSVARVYQVDPTELAKLNGLEEDEYIYPGEEIFVPRAGTGIYITNEGDTLNGVANKLKITPNDIGNQNDNIYLVEDQLIVYKK